MRIELCAFLILNFVPACPAFRPQTERAVSTASLAGALDQSLARGQTDKAREIVAQLLQRPKLDLDTLLRAGVRLAEQELYVEAAQVFARSLKDYPGNFEGPYNLALAEFALQKYPEAIVALEGVQKITTEQELARQYLRGKIYEALGQPAKAQQCLSAAFSGAPQQENYALDLGLYYLRQRAYPQAIRTLERGVKFHPDSPFLSLELSLAYVLGGNRLLAIATCQKLLEGGANASLARLILAFALYMDGDYEKSAKAAAAGLTAPDAHPYLYYLHAASLVKLNSTDYDRILGELNMAARAIRDCGLCYLAQSKVHEELGDDKAAIADLETLVQKLDSGFSQAWYRLAALYQRAGRTADAASARAKFREIKAEEADKETEMIRGQFLPPAGSRHP